MKIKNLKNILLLLLPPPYSHAHQPGRRNMGGLGTVLQEGSRCLKSDDLRCVIDTVKTGEGQGGYLDRGYRGNTDILRHILRTLATPVRTQASTNTVI